MHFRKIISLSCFLISSLSVHATVVSGVVFIDANNNGIKDTNEQGVGAVSVSDQVHVVVTDGTGHYTINPADGNGFVMITVPNGFKSVNGFWIRIDLSSPASYADFPLLKTAEKTDFSFIHASDTHLSQQNIARFEKFAATVDSIKADFLIITGDLIKDALRVPEPVAASLFQLFTTEVRKIKIPVWVIPGNHENFGIERHLSLVSKDNPLYGRKMYRSYLGPDYYSFNFGGFHFIGLNSLEFEDLWYYGSIDSTQVEWLKKDLAALPSKTPVVTFQHVPFFSGGLSLDLFSDEGPGRTIEREKGKLQYRHIVSNAHDVVPILKKHPYPLALAGHYHMRQRFFLETVGQQIRFEQTAAIVGDAESGDFKSPSGFTLYHVRGGKIDEGTFIPLPED